MTRQELQDFASDIVDKPVFDQEKNVIGKIVDAWVEEDVVEAKIWVKLSNTFNTMTVFCNGQEEKV